MIYDLVGQQQRSWGRDLGNVSHSRSLSLIYFTIICDYLLTLLFSFIFFTLFIYDLALETPFLLAEHQKLTNLPFIRPYFIVLSTIYCSVSVLNTLCLFRALRSIFCLSVEFILSLFPFASLYLLLFVSFYRSAFLSLSTIFYLYVPQWYIRLRPISCIHKRRWWLRGGDYHDDDDDHDTTMIASLTSIARYINTQGDAIYYDRVLLRFSLSHRRSLSLFLSSSLEHREKLAEVRGNIGIFVQTD